jgi:hypothetical protein
MQQNVGTQIIGLIWNMDKVSVDYKAKLFIMKELFSGNADHVRC